MSKAEMGYMVARDVLIPLDRFNLEGELTVPRSAAGIVLFAHSSGSSRFSPCNRQVAQTLHEAGIATLLFDLLTAEEEEVEKYTRNLRFDISLLAHRLMGVTRWVKAQKELEDLPVGYFGASTGAAAALVAAAELDGQIAAVVSRGGRPDLAKEALNKVTAPTLLIVGGHDEAVARLNWEAYAQMSCMKCVEIIAQAGHLFEEPGALEEVARFGAGWFSDYFSRV